MPRRIYNEYDDIDMMERRGGQRGGSQGGRGGRYGGRDGNRYPSNERGRRGPYNAYSYIPYSEYEDDDWDEDEEDMDMMYEPEMRRGGRRKRDSRGRFTSRMDDGYYPNGPYMHEGKKNQIGFNRGGVHSYQDFDEEELMAILDEIPDEIPPMEGKKWMKKLKNSDGTSGQHWNEDQLKKLYSEHKIHEKSGGKVSEEDFHYTMNMIYSDYCKALRENGINSIKAYVDLTLAFLMDEDSNSENKLAKYFYAIVNT